MSSGVLGHERADTTCKSCSVCIGAWHKTHLPVFCDGLVQFFKSQHAREVFPCNITAKKSISDVLLGSPYWAEMIFDVAHNIVKKYHIDVLFLSLRAAKIIGLENINNIIRWDLVYVDHNTPAYEVDTNLRGIHEHCRVDHCRCPNFDSLSKKKTVQKEK